MILEYTKVKRKYGSQPDRDFKEATDTVMLGPGSRVSFTTWGPGGKGDTKGTADYRIVIGVQDYEAVIKAMCDTDREAALLAAASVLVPHLTVIKGERDEARAREDEEREERDARLLNLLCQSK